MKLLNQEILLGTMKVKNRFVRSATHDRMGNEDGSLSGAELELYATLAEKEIGLIITGHAYVQHPRGKASIRQNGIFNDSFIPGYREAVRLVHQYGGKLVLQISHAGRQTTPKMIAGETPVAPSAVTDKSTGITPRAMTGEEIEEVIEDFVAAMVRAREAGCDGVQVHAAHGYLISQFLSPYTNRRTDEWGGNAANRGRILEEIIVRGRKALGEDYPILVKLNATDGFTGPGYLTMEDVVFTARMLEKHGVAALEVSGGINEKNGVMSKPGVIKPEQEAYFREAAIAIKAAQVKTPLILVGGLRSLEVMEAVLEKGWADMVALSRPLIKEPDLVVRFKQGQDRAACVSCNACFSPEALACRLKK